MSVDYYARLEQGRVGNVSDQVLTAIADALRLEQIERDHLRALVVTRRPDSNAGRGAPARIRTSVRVLIDSMYPTPAIVQGQHLDLLAANRAAKVLYTDIDTQRPAERNLARWVFLDPVARTRFPQWHEVASSTVAALRAARDPRNPDTALERLVGELSVASPEFARYWAEYRLFKYKNGRKVFFHDAVGALDLSYDTFDIPNSDGQVMCTYTADPGSPTEEKLKLLLSWSADELDAEDMIGTEHPRVDHPGR